MFSDDEIRATILFKLYKRGNWGGSHTAFENMKKGFKEGELGKGGLNRVDKIAKELMRSGLIVQKPTHYGLQVSLNPRQNETIIAIMKKYFPEV
ncbi:hypothetical protein A3K71_01640 [archaeon RBG_16_50_20]|jgi:hypothetical protein|nr:MAG: hypothetical protein A3K71_01640 [archaeon RBG_16_50_20]